MPRGFFALLLSLGFQPFIAMATPGADAPKAPTSSSPSAIPWEQIGVQAGANYRGNGLSVCTTPAGARLRCDFQRMDGEATGEGLWLVSTVANQPRDRFRVLATAVGPQALTARGTVTVTGESAQFARPGLIEQYSVGIDGVRQDFLVERPPAAAGGLIVTLSVSGAKVEAAAGGAQLVLAQSGRKIIYSRVRATDANGKPLPARIQVEQSSEMALVVNDAGAVYPVRIDPTFSDANWMGLGGQDGAGGSVYCEAMDSSGNLYLGGNFVQVGNVLANYVAEWNGTNWSALGAGVNNSVYALAVSGANVYAGGYFTAAGNVTNVNYVAKWDGSNWSALGLGVGPVTSYDATQVRALTVMGTNLYAGGNFTTAGGNPADGIAEWNGSGWSPLGPGLGYVYALAVIGTNLYAGGEFLYAGPIEVFEVAEWNGSKWSAMDSGVIGPVSAFAVAGTNLYAGGEFTIPDPVDATNVALWSNSNWYALGPGVHGVAVNGLALSGTNLYAGGYFTEAGSDTNVNNVAVWNGASWSGLGSGISNETSSGEVYAMVATSNTLYAGGNFTRADGGGANNLAQWNGTNWSALCPGLGGGNPLVRALAVGDGALYIGGEFVLSGTNPSPCVAEWNGSGWSGLGSGMASTNIEELATVNALAVIGPNLYAGGYFNSAGGVAVSSIAQWDGTNWSSMDSGMGGADPSVNALAVSGSTLYAGGGFSGAGQDAGANSIAAWNGTAWSSLDTGVNGEVLALAASGDTLYAGGYFTTAGEDTNANYVAQWDGSEWSSLGSGIGPYELYGPTVNALAVSGATLYIGGTFTNAGGLFATNVAQWDGGSWSPLGTGVTSSDVTGLVLALAAQGGILYVGGDFSLAGNQVTTSVAEANIGGSGPFTPLYIVTANGLFGFRNGSFQFTVDGPAGSNAIVQASTNLLTWIPLGTYLLNSGTFNYTDTLAPDYPVRFYRAQLAP